ncbi:MAG: NAD(+) diphosphatase [Archangium sp.]
MPFVIASQFSEAEVQRSRFFVCGENTVLLRRDSRGVQALPTRDELGPLVDSQVLGSLDDVPLSALPLETRTLEGFEVVGLRSLWSRLDDELFAVAGRANQLVHFAQTNRFCGRCGSKTERHERERALKCSSCGLVVYPRISPAIITLVRKGELGLLANSGRFPVPMFSTLAGFAEVGESLEQTLTREVFEEVGIEVKNVRYFGSQPWPFPNSLMIAFTAEYAGGELRVDGDEIKEAQFFEATALPRIPPRLSIARQLIDAWVTEITGSPAGEHV